MTALLPELIRRARHADSFGRGLATGVLGVVAAVLIANITSASMNSRIVSIEFGFVVGLALARRRPRLPAHGELPAA